MDRAEEAVTEMPEEIACHEDSIDEELEASLLEEQPEHQSATQCPSSNNAKHSALPFFFTNTQAVHKMQPAFPIKVPSHTAHAKKQDCQLCWKTFKSANDLRQHENDVHGKHKTLPSNFGSKFCTSSDRFSNLFTSSNLLNIKEATHSEQQQHRCSVCETRFPSEQQLRDHSLINTAHKATACLDATGVGFDCSCWQCIASFPSLELLEAHIFIEHPDSQPYHCTQCYKTFPKLSEMRSHIGQMHQQLPFLCGACGERFPKKSTLLSHEECHAEYLPSAWKNLFQSVEEKKLLRAEEHRRQDKFVCHNCGLVLHHVDMLVEHKRIASCSPLPHQCHICMRRFNQLKEVQTHAKMHTALPAYRCSACCEQFHSQASLNQHLLSHTGQ